MSGIKKIKKYGWMIRAIAKTKIKVKQAMVRGLRRKKSYYPRKATKADMDNLVKCSLCPNMCRFDCPAVQASKNETHSPAKKATIGYYLEMDRLEKTAENIIPLFEGCVHCSACKMWCPFDFAVGDLLDGVAADLSSSIVIFGATFIHLPVSTTHVISSSILGVGSSHRVKGVKWGTAKRMLITWVITLPISASLAAGISFISILSCLFYPIDIFPENIRFIILLNPLYYYFDLIRLTWWVGIDESVSSYITMNHILVVSIFTIITPLIASVYFDRIISKYGIRGY